MDEIQSIFNLKSVVTTAVTGVALVGSYAWMNKKTQINAANNNIASTKHQAEASKMLRDVMKDESVGSVFWANGEQAQIYVREQGRNSSTVDHGTFHLRHGVSLPNYNMALRDHLCDPKGILDIVKNPRPLDDFTRKTQAKVKEISRGAWADNPLRKTFSVFGKNKNLNTDILIGAHSAMKLALEDLISNDAREDVISSRDMIAVKYREEDKTHYVVIPSNKVQHDLLDRLIGEGVRDPKEILEAISEDYRHNHYPEGSVYTHDSTEPA
ncbi:MAG: hypothetical protein ACRBDL_10720 [Alphaproteobacteria bacterium]